jgi:hypothetical protein
MGMRMSHSKIASSPTQVKAIAHFDKNTCNRRFSECVNVGLAKFPTYELVNRYPLK